MSALYAYSLVPVLSVALLLFFTAALRGRNTRGLSLYCLSIAVWSGVLLAIQLPATEFAAVRLAAAGAFIAAAYLHAAFDLIQHAPFGLSPALRRTGVWFAYLVATALTALGALYPGVLYDPQTLTAGPLFWPGMALAIAAATVPLTALGRAFRLTEPTQRGPIRGLFFAGLLGYCGSLLNAVLLAHGRPLPFGLFLVLASMLVLANVIRAHQQESDRRLLERSLLYSALAAFLSAGFLFGVLSLFATAREPLVREYRLGALFLLCMGALALEPLRQQLSEWLGRRIAPGRATSTDLARVLAEKEKSADQAARLAELGVLASAVAHEVRNPLGVLMAHLKLLERQGASAETVADMRAQIDRATRFLDDLLRYGRPRPLEIRQVELGPTVDLAVSSARQALAVPESITVERRGEQVTVEADQAQLTQTLIVLVENALLALAERGSGRVIVTLHAGSDSVGLEVEDDGPGIPEALLPRLFQPFVTGRKRDGPRSGTGLGLAIARGIVERHGGRIQAGRSTSLGGARFEITLPRRQPVLAALSSS